MSSDHSDYLFGNSSITDFDIILCIFLCLKISFKTYLCFCMRNNNICYGLNETNKTSHMQEAANQLALKSISQPETVY